MAPVADEGSKSAVEPPSEQPGAPLTPSVPREDWPCEVVLQQGDRGPIGDADWDGLREPIVYAGPKECRFPPDRWEPGCPTQIGKRRFSYDRSGRLSKYTEMGVSVAESLAYSDSAILSIDECLTYSHEDDRAVVKAHGDCPFGFSTRHVERGPHGYPTRVVDFDDAGQPSTRELSTFEGSRLATRTMEFNLAGDWKLMVTQRFKYECGKRPAG